MSPLDFDEIAHLLVRRRDLFDLLLDGIRDRRVLVEEADISRATVYRGLEDLERAGAVEVSGREYHPTTSGRTVFRALDRFRSVVRSSKDADELLEGLPHESHPDPWLVAGATVVTPDPVAPHEPVSWFADVIRSARRFIAVGIVLYPEVVGSLAESVESGFAQTW